MPHRIPDTMYGLTTLIVAGIASGGTLVASTAVLLPSGPDLAAIQAHTPDVASSMMALMVLLATYVLKNSGEKTAGTHHKDLMDRLIVLATGVQGNSMQLQSSRVEFSSGFSGIDQNVSNIVDRIDGLDVKLDKVEDRLVNIGERVTTVESRCAVISMRDHPRE